MAIITISRGTFAGGKELAECVATKLSYRCVSRELLLADTASKYGVTEQKLVAALDNKPGFFEGLSLQRIHYIAYIRAVLAKQAQEDNVVYHGQVGHFRQIGDRRIGVDSVHRFELWIHRIDWAITPFVDQIAEYQGTPVIHIIARANHGDSLGMENAV